MFADGERRVDFVLAWEEVARKDRWNEEAAARRQIFQAHLQREGLQLEMEKEGRLNFIKMHAPLELLCRYCEIMKLRMPMKEVQNGFNYFCYL